MVEYHIHQRLLASSSGHDGDHRNMAVDVHAGCGYQQISVLTQILLCAGLLLILECDGVTLISRFAIHVRPHERGLQPLKLDARALLLFTLPLELICEVKQLALRPL